MDNIKLWAYNGEAVRRAIWLGVIVHINEDGTLSRGYKLHHVADVAL